MYGPDLTEETKNNVHDVCIGCKDQCKLAIELVKPKIFKRRILYGSIIVVGFLIFLFYLLDAFVFHLMKR